MNRRMFMASGLLAAAARTLAAGKMADVLLVERIGPTSSELYIANADAERVNGSKTPLLINLTNHWERY